MTTPRRMGRMLAMAVFCLGAALMPSGPAVAASAHTRHPAAARSHTATVKLIAAQRSITIPRFRSGVLLDPGVWVAAAGSDLEFRVTRASYTKPVMLTQVIREARGRMRERRLSSRLLAGWNGLARFLQITVRTTSGTVVATKNTWFCPDSFAPARTSPAGPMNSPYPSQCNSFDPFPRGEVWGIARGWAVDPFAYSRPPLFKLAPGTYKVSVSIFHRYVRLLHVLPKNAKATVTVKVVNGCRCRGCRCRPGRHASRPVGDALRALPDVPTLKNPPRSARPDLVALPSWNISTGHPKGGTQDLLNFAATVWIGGHSPLDVEGFRSNGSPTMKAYQYFWQDGKLIGRVRAGTMGFDSRHGHDHWHFQQFAAYRLLSANKKLAVASHKVGFCIAPSDGVNLTMPHATWRPPIVGFTGQCGLPTALWVRERLPIGWGDTYMQTVAGQSFDITNVPNGTYYIEVIANPEHVLRETTTKNDVSLRKVILGGQPGARTVKVPAWHGIDPEP